jgi:hypothetical protein
MLRGSKMKMDLEVMMVRRSSRQVMVNLEETILSSEMGLDPNMKSRKSRVVRAEATQRLGPEGKLPPLSEMALWTITRGIGWVKQPRVLLGKVEMGERPREHLQERRAHQHPHPHPHPPGVLQETTTTLRTALQEYWTAQSDG